MTYSDNRPADTGIRRLGHIDAAKALGIYLVILAHTHLFEPIQNWIYTFHMPLFFFISGYLFSYERNTSAAPFIRKRFRQLIIPYAAINLITWLAWALAGRNFGSSADQGIPLLAPLKAALLGYGAEMVHDVPLWFLLCLFIIETIHYLLFRRKGFRWSIVLIFVFLIAGYVNYALNPVLLPFSLGTVLTGMVFYATGHLLRQTEFRLNIAAAMLYLAATIAIAWLNGRINMHVNYYGNYLLFFLGGFSGIFMVMYACRAISKLLTKNNRFAASISQLTVFISNNTLLTCGFHLLCFSFIKALLVFVLRVDYSGIDDTVMLNIVFSLSALFICLGGIIVYEKMKSRLRTVFGRFSGSKPLY